MNPPREVLAQMLGSEQAALAEIEERLSCAPDALRTRVQIHAEQLRMVLNEFGTEVEMALLIVGLETKIRVLRRKLTELQATQSTSLH